MIARMATAADVPGLLALYRALVGAAPLAGEEAVGTVLAHPGTEIWVLQEAGRSVSMATLHMLPNVTQGGRPYALVENVVTLTECQGRGYGRAVMDAVIARAWAVDAYKIMLLSGKTGQAKGFYERLGFSADEKWGMTLRRAPLRSA